MQLVSTLDNNKNIFIKKARGSVAIDSQEHKELVTEMRIATSDQVMILEKDEINTMDLLDSLRLAMCMIK
jgi:hypothetical protein